jgi:tRNA (cytidine/uridine-2'-O-)-methyltransferase
MENATQQRLRAEPTERAFEILLVEPEIPPNTGNIARLCAATGSRLHLVEPLGFRIDEHAVRRAGLDYWPLVQVRTHPNFAAAEQHLQSELPERRFWLFSGKTALSYLDVPFRLGDVLVFGKESVGLPPALLERDPSTVVGIPTLGAVRSLNLANAVSIALYEALRQVGALAPATLR